MITRSFSIYTVSQTMEIPHFNRENCNTSIKKKLYINCHESDYILDLVFFRITLIFIFYISAGI